MLDTIIINGIVVTQNEKRQILNTNIGIKDGKIEKIGSEFWQADKIIDASNYVITPAYLNGHVHFGEYYLRGYKGKVTTEEYIKLGERFHDFFIKENEEIRNSSIDNVMLESIQNGTLTMFGVRGWPNAQKFGINVYLGYPIMNSGKLSSYIEDFERRFIALRREKHAEYFLGLHSLKWVNEENLHIIAEFLSKHKEIKMSLHICETKEEISYIKKKYKTSPIKLLEMLNLLNENTLLVHCNYLNDEDINLIRKRKASVAVCHSSNLKLGNKPCDASLLLRNGINIMIATDGPATSDSLSLLDAIKLTALISDIDAQNLYDMITVNPAKYMNINTGSVQIGNQADLLFYDRNSLNITYRNSILENLIYLSNNRPRNIMKSGNFIIKNYKFINGIEKSVLREKSRIIQLIEKKTATEESAIMSCDDF